MSSARLSTIVGSGPVIFRVEVLEANNGTWFFRITEIRAGEDRKEQHATMLEFGDSSDQFGFTGPPGVPRST